jgi:RNA recognition motif-containing protein
VGAAAVEAVTAVAAVVVMEAAEVAVGVIEHSIPSSDLQEWFTPFGTVQSGQVITGRETGESKGFGVVEMDTDAQAQVAIQGLDDHEHEGRRLKASEAKPREARTVALDGRARQCI